MIPLNKFLNFILIYSKKVSVNKRGGMDERAPNPWGHDERTVAPPACANKENSTYSFATVQ